MPGALPQDDPTIGDEERLYRRVYPNPDELEADSTGTGYRPRSGAFRGEGALSVDLSSLSTPEETRSRHTPSNFYVAEFSARTAREAGCVIVRDPQPDDPAHALVYGLGEAGALTKSQTKKIGRMSRIVLM